MRPSGILLSSRVSLNAIKSMFLLQTICYIYSSILPGNVTIFRKAILNPLFIGNGIKCCQKIATHRLFQQTTINSKWQFMVIYQTCHGNSSNVSVIRWSNTSTSCGGIENTLFFKYLHRSKSHGVKSAESEVTIQCKIMRFAVQL